MIRFYAFHVLLLVILVASAFQASAALPDQSLTIKEAKPPNPDGKDCLFRQPYICVADPFTYRSVCGCGGYGRTFGLGW